MTGFVVDSSLALTWLFPDEATSASEALLLRLEQETAVVPGWWYLELTNVLAQRLGDALSRAGVPRRLAKHDRSDQRERPASSARSHRLAERRGRITPAQTSAFLAAISALDIEIDNDSADRVFTEILPLCRRINLTSYDALYLELALRRQLPLATLDIPLRKAAKALGVQVLG